jgi:hypothetical protein
MCGLVLPGLDPNEFGYEMDQGTFDEIVRRFERGSFVVDEHTKFHWLDLQDHVTVDREFPVAGATEFFEWLDAVDIESVTKSASRPSHRKLVRLVARNVPYPVYNSLYPLYDSIATAVRTRWDERDPYALSQIAVDDAEGSSGRTPTPRSNLVRNVSPDDDERILHARTSPEQGRQADRGR